MEEKKESRIVAYDPDEQIILVNRKTGKSCAFLEAKNEYLILDKNTHENIIIKKCTEDELKCCLLMDEVMQHSSRIRRKKKIDSDFNRVSIYLSNLVLPDKEVPIYAKTKEYYLHITKYK